MRVGGLRFCGRELVLKLLSWVIPTELWPIELHRVCRGPVPVNRRSSVVRELSLGELLQLDRLDRGIGCMCGGCLLVRRGLGVLELSSGYVLGCGCGRMLELSRGKFPGKHRSIELRELRDGHLSDGHGRNRLRGLPRGDGAGFNGCGPGVGVRCLRCRDVLGGIGERMHELRSGSVCGVWRRDGMPELRDGHLLLCNGVVSVQQLHRRYLPGVDGGIVVVELHELRGGPILGRGRKHVHELLGGHVLGIGRRWCVHELRGGYLLCGGVERLHGLLGRILPAVNGGVGLSGVRAWNVFRSRRIGMY